MHMPRDKGLDSASTVDSTAPRRSLDSSTARQPGLNGGLAAAHASTQSPTGRVFTGEKCRAESWHPSFMRLSRALGRPLLPCAGLVVPSAPRWLRCVAADVSRDVRACGLRHHPTLTYCKPRQRQPAQQQLVPPGSVRAHLLQARARACPSPGRRRRQAMYMYNVLSVTVGRRARWRACSRNAKEVTRRRRDDDGVE
jgi:hypothetical protein